MGKIATAAGEIAAATIYTTGRSVDTILTWAEAATLALLQANMAKDLLDKQKGYYDDIAKKKLKAVEAAINNYILRMDNEMLPLFRDAYPDVPVAVAYVPPDPAAITYQTMIDNIGNETKAREYVMTINSMVRENYAVRLEVFSPGFSAMLVKASRSISELLDGRFSVGTLIEITTDAAENACITGKIGMVRKATARSIGLNAERMKQQGRDELRKHAEMLNRDVSPITADVNIADLMQNPKEMITLSLQTTQLVQNSLQNIANAAAQKPPYLLAQLQAKLQKVIALLTYEANKANMQNDFVPNYAAAFQPALDSIFHGSQRRTEPDAAADKSHPRGSQPTPVA